MLLKEKSLMMELSHNTPWRGSKTVTALSDNDYLYKVQVCTTDKKKATSNKIKGVRAWYRTITSKPASFQLVTNKTPIEAKRTNCKKWHSPVSCPAGKVAVGVKGHKYHEKYFLGLSLICRKIVKK